jgi:hypothetical protein
MGRQKYASQEAGRKTLAFFLDLLAAAALVAN